MVNLAERELDGYDNRTIRIDMVSPNVLLVSVTHDNEIEWQEHTDEGKQALDMYYHPFACGYKGGKT